MEKASKSNNYHYNRKLKNFANDLRKRMTKSEACLWKYVLKNRMMKGYQFRRQRPILNYIVDFVCLDLLLIIEVDGISHEIGDPKKDLRRDQALAAVGFTTLRYSSEGILTRIDEIEWDIEGWILEHAICPPPNPRRQET